MWETETPKAAESEDAAAAAKAAEMQTISEEGAVRTALEGIAAHEPTETAGAHAPSEGGSPHTLAGLDVGSTTAKLVIVEETSGRTLFARYRRHHAQLEETAAELLGEAARELGNVPVLLAVCGSGGEPIAQLLGAPYVQEVVANAIAVGKLYPQARCAIELGGQDAKALFFRTDKTTGRLVASDMRMNGSCAGGTGAFLDETASLLDATEEGLESLASQGSRVHQVSGRCGVFAKTDIQPLLIQGARAEDLALSAFHAVAKQTIGGLAQGLELEAPIVFEGGPLTYNPTLVRVFAERLGLKPQDVILPEHPETIVAYGTALAARTLADGRKTKRSDEAAGANAAVGASPSDPASRPGRLPRWTLHSAEAKLHAKGSRQHKGANRARALFATPEEQERFLRRHAAEGGALATPEGKPEIPCYIGIDSGSTTSKVALLSEDGDVFDTLYAHNDGAPLETVRDGLLQLEEKYRARGQRLAVLGVGTTGYGEQMMAAALEADASSVETVAHARACARYVPEATFVLDIGGQDMKAIWLNDGAVTDIMLNEACSSGCGSFLENFADSLGITCDDIAEAAFASESPAELGSRCTVFMTSTVITEQRNGKQPNDIMAGLCRSIIENVFTKVVRVPHTDNLGPCVVAQGGTFRNDAVLRALEEYLGHEVIRAPFPGEMGAIGAALVCRDRLASRREERTSKNRDGRGERSGQNGQDGCKSSFIGFDALRTLGYSQEHGRTCTGCANSCSLTVTRFSTGTAYATGNKCPRGAGEDPKAARRKKASASAANLHEERARMLFELYPVEPVRDEQPELFGLPRVLEFWDSMPFWSTFLRTLGYRVTFSHPSSARMLEEGLRYVASDTVCLPAKIVHGHVFDLCRQGASRILFPYVMHMPPEGQDKMSPYMCAIVMGYPMVVKNFQDPATAFGVQLDTPVFHWFTESNREKQIHAWACSSLGATASQAKKAYLQAEQVLLGFRNKLARRGEEVLATAREDGRGAVVVAGRPYHSDPFISHKVAERFSSQGMAVLTPDSLPGLSEAPLDNLLPEVTNNFHTRMLESALIAAAEPNLHYVQLVSFGCGHDAILSDEITRILREVGGKAPLVLKLDESDATGSIGIRVQSFIETMRIGRNGGANTAARGEAPSTDKTLGFNEAPAINVLGNPYATAFAKDDKARRTLLIPNISGEVSLMLQGAMLAEGFKAKVLPIGGPEQIKLGKRYTHNDICFPCQMVIGEVLDELQSGAWRTDEVAVGMVKFKCDCRMSHYAALLRRALDRAGYGDVPILTTDPVDTKGMHPGIAMLGPGAVIKAVWAAMMLDILQDIKRKTRPYELQPGQTEKVFAACVNNIANRLKQGLAPAISAYREAIGTMASIPIDRCRPKPRVFVTGELLVTYHPGSNFHIEDYLIEHGMEPMFPRVTDQLRKDFTAAMAEISDFGANISKESFPVTALFNLAQTTMERIARAHPLFEPEARPDQMYEEVAHIIPKTLSCGEGWLMAAEIAHWAKRGVRSFVILQPFGCLPNHICGRGVTKRLKDEYPGIQILPLDLDPDASQANIENRLQMLIMQNLG